MRRILAGERKVLRSPAWLVPIDITRDGPPIAPLQVRLQRAEGAEWVDVDLAPARTPSGALIYPGLGKRSEPAIQPTLRYRAVFTGAAYLPLYRALRDGVEFDVPPYDDLHPPTQQPRLQRVPLAPAPAYAFPADVRVMRGRVVTTAGVPVADALVRSPYSVGAASRLERTLTDADGRFALPLRWAKSGTVTLVNAIDRRGSPTRRGSLKINVPADLGHEQTIQIG